MPKKKLDLFKLASGFMTQTRTAAAQVVRRQMIDAGISSTTFHNVPDNVNSHSGYLTEAALPKPPENPAFRDSGC